MKKLLHRKKQRPLFHPDQISTGIHRALCRDTGPILHEYDRYGPQLVEAASIQSRELLKKYIPEDCETKLLEEEAFEKFRKVNDHMLESNIRFLECYPNSGQKTVHGLNIGPSIVSSRTSRRDKALLRAQSLIGQVLGSWTIEELFLESRNSQGSSIGVPFTDTSMEKKFRYPISATSTVVSLFNAYLDFDSMLKSVLERQLENNPLLERYSLQEGSRATTVEKNATTRRFISIECTANMFFQQGLMSMLYRRMRTVGLDVESLPDKHRWLARINSISSDLCTIDWSSASDCVSIELLRFLLPPKWFDIIDRVRSPSTQIGKERVTTHMISTMGNAATFPLETLVFWSLGVALWSLDEYPDNRLFLTMRDLKKSRISVFGDDCILPTNLAEEYITLMTDLGFIINKDKSFYDNGITRFRESCGGDYRAGYNVRPFHLKAPHNRNHSSLEPWLYIILNALIPRYIVYFGTLSWCYDRELFRFVERLFVENNLQLKIVPHDYPDDAGLKISFDMFRFLECYPGFRKRISMISVNRHGTVSFKYLRFQYRYKEKQDMDLRYAWRLKEPRMSRLPICESFNPKRRLGGYVVAKALTGHWSVPKGRPTG